MSNADRQRTTSIAAMGGRVARQLMLWISDAQPTDRPCPPRKPKTQPKSAPLTPPTVVVPRTMKVPQPAAEAQAEPTPPTMPDGLTMKERYAWITKAMLATHGVRVRKWRTSMSGVAWQVTYQDGTMARLIEAPRPTGPMSAAVFLHEVGHHAIGFGTYKPRCLEEYHAWRWSLEQMHANGLNVTDAVRHRVHLSLWYAVDKANRRGLRSIPEELLPYVRRPASMRRKAGVRT